MSNGDFQISLTCQGSSQVVVHLHIVGMVSNGFAARQEARPPNPPRDLLRCSAPVFGLHGRADAAARPCHQITSNPHTRTLPNLTSPCTNRRGLSIPRST